jgi:hypothetical protein
LWGGMNALVRSERKWIRYTKVHSVLSLWYEPHFAFYKNRLYKFTMKLFTKVLNKIWFESLFLKCHFVNFIILLEKKIGFQNFKKII